MTTTNDTKDYSPEQVERFGQQRATMAWRTVAHPQTVADALTAAAEIIIEHGWIRGQGGDTDFGYRLGHRRCPHR